MWFIKIAVETQFEVADLDEIQDVFVSQYILVYRIVVENPLEVAELVVAVCSKFWFIEIVVEIPFEVVVVVAGLLVVAELAVVVAEIQDVSVQLHQM